jgi:hypothetical protein
MLSKAKHLCFRGSATKRNNQRFFALLRMTNNSDRLTLQRFNASTISFDPLNAKPILNFYTKITTGDSKHATCCWNQSARLHFIDENG